MNHKQILALFLCFVILLSPIIVSAEKEKIVNVKKVDNSIDEFTIESIVIDDENGKINVYYPVTKCVKANGLIQEKVDYYIDKFKSTDTLSEGKELNISFEKYESGSIDSFKFEVDSNVGVTHDTKEFFTVVYEGDEVITIDSLLKTNPNLLDDLYVEAKQQLECNEKFKEYSNLIWLENGLKKTKNTFSNFIFSDNNIIIIFNPYTVAPFVAGVFEIEISCDLI
jgi:hypothetical protein